MLLSRAIKINQKGAVATFTVLGVFVVLLAITAVVTSLAMEEFEMSKDGGSIEETFYAAEAGLNEALYRLISNPSPGTINFELDNIQINTTVSVDPGNPFGRIVSSQAIDQISGKQRTVQVSVVTDSYAGGFDYAVQGGNGGIYLDNNSMIIGDLYSNGSVLPASGGSTGNINGSVWSAGSNLVDKVNVTENVYAENISRSDIDGGAYYTNIDSSTDVGGASCPNANCHSGNAGPDSKPFPIDDGIITIWKNDIINAGNPVLGETPADCPPSRSSGYYCVTNNKTLGSSKIEANFYIGNGATLELDGNLWISGDIIMDNNGTISIDSDLGKQSVVVISDGTIEVNNNYSISGSGEPGSFVLVVSMSTNINPSSPAIYASNNSSSVVFAALHGMLKVKNNGALNTALGEKLYLEPNSTVTYNPIFSVFSISPSSGNEVDTITDTWTEL